jgi:regulator of RNase E activity RraA
MRKTALTAAILSILLAAAPARPAQDVFAAVKAGDTARIKSLLAADSSLVGQIVTVRIIEAFQNSLLGELV